LEENSEEEENSQSESKGEGILQLFLYNTQFMVGNNPNTNQPYEPQLLLDAVIIPRILHGMPKHPKSFSQCLIRRRNI
jgi:hypothetical protein